MATVTNNEKFLLGVSSDDFRGININDPIAYNGNAKYYDPLLFYAFQGAKKGRWNEMENRYKNEDEYDDMYLRIGDKYIRINPNFVTAGSGKNWGTYRYMDENNLEKSVTLSPDNIFYRFNPNIGAVSTTGTSSTSTSTPTGGYLHLNDKTAPVISPNYGAYTYSEWMGDTNPWGAANFNDIRNLGNIYGDIDTEDELNIFANLYGAQNAIDYINSHSGGNPLFVGKKFSGNADDVRRAAALLGQYAASDEGKPFYEQLRRGYASLGNMDKYEAYAATKGWTGSDGGEDRNYLNEARNSVDGRYNGARFFMDYAGDKTWGILANEFARNNRFREDYTVNGKHVMERLKRDAGLGDGRTLIQIYNDIISKNPDLMNDDERKYRIFRDMTRRRFKLDNNFWNRYGLMDFARNSVYGTNNIRFKDGGQIFRMLFV